MANETQKGEKDGEEEDVRAGDIDEKSIQATGEKTCRAKRYSDGEFWNFSLAADDLKGWRTIVHEENQAKVAKSILGRK